MKASLERDGAIFQLSRGPTIVSPGIMTSGEIPLVSGFEKVDDSLLIGQGDILGLDPMEDDQALIVDTTSGLVVILGCAHRGIINTLNHACKLTGVSKILAVIGGMRLFRASKEQVHAHSGCFKINESRTARSFSLHWFRGCRALCKRVW